MKIPQSEKVWIAGGAGSALLLVVIAWFTAISPQLSQASSLRSQRDDAQSQNEILLSRTNSLRKDSANLPTLVTSLKGALATLPVTSGLSDFTVQLNRQAAAAHVSITGIVASPAAAVGSNGTASTGAATAGGGAFGVAMTITTAGPLAGQRAFLDAVQRTGPRAALVSSTKLVPLGSTSGIDAGATMTTVLTVFVTPLNPAAAAQLASELNPGSSN